MNKFKLLHGKLLSATAFSEDCIRPAHYLTNNSKMSGSISLEDVCAPDGEQCFLSAAEKPEVIFSFDKIERLGLMQIYNFNMPGCETAGMRKIRLYHSFDKKNWQEFKGRGYPFELALSPGGYIKATNLNDGENSPIDFEGLEAKYIKIEAIPIAGDKGGYMEGKHAYGLAAVRFFEYLPALINGEEIVHECIYPLDTDGILSSKKGLTAKGHSVDPRDMYISQEMPIVNHIIFDLKGTYPLDRMEFFNYNEKGNTGCGLHRVDLSFSVDGRSYTAPKKLRLKRASGTPSYKGERISLDNVSARFVKFEVKPEFGTHGLYSLSQYRYGLSKVRFFIGSGLCAVPAYEWDAEFSDYSEWGGADGIFIVPTDGNELQTDELKDSLVLFSDTFVGTSNPVTRHRHGAELVHNTMGFLKNAGNTNREIEFFCNRDEDGKFIDIIKPDTDEFFYWLQDAVCINGNVYTFTDNIVAEETGIPGFEFRMIGVDMIKIPLKGNRPDVDNIQKIRTPFFTEREYIGCSILPNTEKCSPYADGYIYVYGLRQDAPFAKSLIVSRVLEEDFEDFSKYRFFDGENWVEDITQSVSIAPDGGSECSVTPVTFEGGEGKFVYSHMLSGIGNVVAISYADSPTGPFNTDITIYNTREALTERKANCKDIYMYNAKAHHHISQKGELLISYNVNAMDFETNLINCDVYRPRFIRLTYIK